MSGPKVVRIVTREEIGALCEGHLARVAAAMAEWVRVGRRNDCVSEADIAQAELRLARLRNLLATDRFMDLQKQAPQAIAFLHADLQGRLGKVAAADAIARSSHRRQAEAADALLKALKARGADVPSDLEAALVSGAAGRPNPQAIAIGFALLSAQTDADRGARDALAQSLKDGSSPQTLASWIATQPAPPADPLYVRLERRLSELALISEPELIATFEARLDAARASETEPRRRLLLDSLELDVAAKLVDARKRAKARDELRMCLAELALVDEVAHQEIAMRCEAPESDVVERLAEANEMLRSRRDAQAAHARRMAVLQGLAGLGYEVGTELATAWVDQGRVVLRKAAQQDYGIELSGDPSAARLQMRVVAFGDAAEGADPARDADAETLWCGDVAALEDRLARVGSGLVIERAMPVGATPVKRVAASTGALSRVAREGAAAQSRTLP